MAEGGQTLWLLLAVAVQAVWGVYPVLIRFMQTKTPHPLTALQLSFVVNLWSIPALLIGDLLGWIVSCCSKGRGKAKQGALVTARGAPAPAAPAEASDSPSAPLLLPNNSGLVQPGPPSTLTTDDPPLVVAPTPTSVCRRPQPTLLRKAVVVLTGTTTALTALFLTQIFSLRFTAAYMSQMLFLLAPLMVALMARLLFKSPLPPGLWSALALMLLGSGMVVGSKAANASQGPASPPLPALHQQPTASDTHTWVRHMDAHLAGGSGSSSSRPEVGMSLWPGVLFGAPPALEQAAFLAADNNSLAIATATAAFAGAGDSIASSWGPASLLQLWLLGPLGKGMPVKPRSGLALSDVIGLTLALGSALSLASFMLIVQRSHGVVSEQMVLWCCSLFQCALSCVLTRTLESYRWHMLFKLLPWEWGCVAGTAFGVNWAANLLQQVTIRKLGAPQAAAFLPVRLLGSLAASYPILHEKLDSPTEAAGAALLLAAVTGYLLRQRTAAVEVARAAAAVRLAQEEASLEP